MDFRWSDEETQLRTELRTYMEDHLMPGWSFLERDMPTPERIADVITFCTGLAERGLLVPAWPEEYGGRGASRWAQIIISEEMRAVSEPRGPQYMNVNWIGPAIMELGTDSQKERYTGPIAAGEAMWCQGFSEPDAGSDLSALRTTAIRDGDHYLVNGQKIWTSYAHAADFCFTLVRTAQTENPRRGISVLLVPMDLPGIEVREIPALGMSHLVHEVFFHDVAVPADCRLGEENEGWRIIRTLLANERAQNSRHSAIEGALDQLVDEAAGAGADTAGTSFWEHLGRAAAWTAASRILNYVAVQAWSDDSAEFANLAAVYRASMAQMELGAAQTFIDVLGPDALLTTSRGDWQLAGGTLSTIGAGSLEMQLNNVAWYILGLPK
jgi:alkylation response protein AidB-like acyl-CoA dehydrogenase